MRCSFCQSDNVDFDNAQAVCSDCGTVMAESQIVSDVTFGETSAGAATVQGSYLSQDQSHVRSSNPRFRSGGSGESREATLHRAKDAIDRMGRAHRVGASTRDKATRMFRLAIAGEVDTARLDPNEQTRNFVLGRKQEYTVAACLYVACRKDKTSHMLIDFADAMNINVFTLGRHYLKLLRALNMQLPVIDPAVYLSRFAALLHFGEETQRVATDAARLVRRFNDDWIVQGRRPAGVCGAALLLAARMNNFRRSLNEIVQVVKMADVTIRERLNEFKRTPSAKMTVADFKKVWLEEQYEPPSFYRPAIEAEKKAQREEKAKAREEQARLKEERKAERAAKRIKRSQEDAGDDGDDEGEGGAGQDAENDPPFDPESDALLQQALQDEMGQYIAEPGFRDLNRQLEERELAAQERARLGGTHVGSAPEIEMNEFRQRRAVDEEDEEEEARRASERANQERDAGPPDANLLLKESSTQKEADEQAVLNGNVSDANGNGNAEAGPSRASPAAAPTSAPPAQAEAGPSTTATSTSSRRPKYSQLTHGAPIEDPLTDLDEEELDQFILGPEEVRIKERVWMEFNHDYLVAAMKRQLKEEADEKAGIKSRRRNRKPPPKPRDSSTATGANANEAAMAMMAKKTKSQPKSRKINYDAMLGIGGIFDGQNGAQKGKKKKRKQQGNAGGGSQRGGSASELEPVEEEGDALPSNDPRRRQESRANKKRKARAASGGEGGATSGDDTGGETTDLGTQRGDTDGEAGDDDDDEVSGMMGGEGDMARQMRFMYSQQGEGDDYDGEEAY